MDFAKASAALRRLRQALGGLDLMLHVATADEGGYSTVSFTCEVTATDVTVEAWHYGGQLGPKARVS